MPVPSMRPGCLALAATLAAVGAPACDPIFHVPRGFEVDGPADVSANGTVILHLPANARGAVYTNDVDGRPRHPRASAFRLVDRTAGRRLRTQVVGSAAASGGPGTYLVEPVGGFVAGRLYDLSTSRPVDFGSPFHLSLRLVIDAAIAWPPAARAIRLQPQPEVADGANFVVTTPVLDPGLAAYRDQITISMRASPPVMAEEASWNGCSWGEVSVLRRSAACHVISATFSYPAMSDLPAGARGFNRAECASR